MFLEYEWVEIVAPLSFRLRKEIKDWCSRVERSCIRNHRGHNLWLLPELTAVEYTAMHTYKDLMRRQRHLVTPVECSPVKKLQTQTHNTRVYFHLCFSRHNNVIFDQALYAVSCTHTRTPVPPPARLKPTRPDSPAAYTALVW